MLPPHLPAPASSLAQRQVRLRLQIILVAVVFGFISGLSGAAIMLGWVMPANFLGGRGGTLAFRPAAMNALSDATLAELNQSVVTIYSKLSDESGVKFFDQRDMVGPAVVLSNDGWIVLQRSANIPAVSRVWRVFTSGGAVFEIEKTALDNTGGFLYLKLAVPASLGAETAAAISFRPVVFAESPRAGDTVYVGKNGFYQSAIIAGVSSVFGKIPHLDTATSLGYLLDANVSAPAVVVTESGKFLGMVVSGQVAAPAFAIDRIWPQVLGSGKIAYPSLGVEGWFANERPIIVQGKRQSGFVVTSARSPGSLLRRGDVVTLVAGEPITPASWYSAVQNSTKVAVTVLRANKTIELTVPVVKL